MKNSKNLRKWLDDMNLSHPLLIAGPCSAETEKQVLDIAHQLKDSDTIVYRAGIWKPRTRPDRKSTRLNSSHSQQSRMPSSA